MPSQGLQQVQKLGLQQTLSPQMQQSLHILQVPALELSALIRQELTTNPVLEEEAKEEVEAGDPADLENGDSNGEDGDLDKEFKELARLDEEWRDYFRQSNLPARPTAEQESQRRTFLESVAKPDTLREHLLGQIHERDVPSELLSLCETLIGNLDGRGFLVATPEDMREWGGSRPGAAEEALRLIQSLDPIGVGARDLRECLLLQLERLGHQPGSLAHRVVSGHLDALAARKHGDIAVALECPLDDVRRAAALIATLDPQPGSRFEQDDNRYISADLVAQKIGEEWVVFANDDWLPSVRINNTYKDILGQSSQNSEAKTYVRERLRAARFFIKSIEQRKQTVLRIAHEILASQADFFNLGPEFLKPLTMTEVAHRIGVHETTVSRAIANKYMQTPHGLFELKFFFTPGLRLADGRSMTVDEVKAALATLVADEPAERPLTDEDMMKALQARGIPIARRTVAKYREELKILPSHLRKAKPA